MSGNKGDLILHPVRMRIIQVLLNGDSSAQEMKKYLPDIPQATLYRHLKKLADGGIIRVAAETPIRGAVEKVYSLETDISAVQAENQPSKEELLGYFIKFTSNLVGEFEAYLHDDEVDLAKDGVSFRQASIYMDDDEFESFVKELRAAFTKVIGNKPIGRKRRTIATIIIPEGKNNEPRGK